MQGQLEAASAHARFAAKALFSGLYYVARVQSVVDYHAQQGVKVKKEAAKTMRLEREQYLEVTNSITFHFPC